jgi:hypothetical protein
MASVGLFSPVLLREEEFEYRPDVRAEPTGGRPPSFLSKSEGRVGADQTGELKENRRETVATR